MKEFDNYFKGDYSEEEEKTVTGFFCDYNRTKELDGELHRVFYNFDLDKIDDGKKFQHLLEKIHYNINIQEATSKKRRHPIVIKFLEAAAIIAFLLLSNYITANYYNRIDTGITSAIYAPTWSKIRFTLPEGTTGWLNNGSSLEYKGDFLNKREVYLEGEAYFEVAHNPQKPFIVNSPTITAKAIGTKFNMASYNNELRSELFLEEGIVEYSNNTSKEQIRMGPSDLVIYDKESQQTTISKEDVSKYTSWIEGMLVFKDDPITSVANRIARWYNVDVEVIVSNPDHFRWRATFDNESLSGVLEALSLSLGLKCTIVGSSLSLDDDSATKTKVYITDSNTTIKNINNPK